MIPSRGENLQKSEILVHPHCKIEKMKYITTNKTKMELKQCLSES